MSGIYLGLGGNLGAVGATFAAALHAFEADGLFRVQQCSRLWCSPAWGFEGPDFLNAVVAIETDQSPRAVLEALLAYELRCGRVRQEGMGSRPIDLDLLAWGGLRCAEPGLILPHPGTPSRRFVLEPLHDVAPDLVLPGLGAVATHLAEQRLRDAQVWVLEDSADWRSWPMSPSSEQNA